MNRSAKISLLFLTNLLLFISFIPSLLAQYKIEGYVYESGNRGYITAAQVQLIEKESQQLTAEGITDEVGKYVFDNISEGDYLIHILRDPHFERVEALQIDPASPDVTYLKHELKRKPGYIFEINLTESDPDADPDDAKFVLKGATVEVFNNTKREETLVIHSLEEPVFKVDLLKGNHYTLLVSKEGFLSKRMEALVDVQSCILCFEGVGNVRPGVADNLTEGNQTGSLLANVELDRAIVDQVIPLGEVYYKTAQYQLNDAAKQSLDQVARFLSDNPNLIVEIGSHTDATGRSSANQRLSQKRAATAAEYLIRQKEVPSERVKAKGYGETKLKNKCKDGVKCSDAEHAQNRRTEVKILATDYPARRRSLREIRNEEMIFEIIDELGDTQVRMPDTTSTKQQEPPALGNQSVEDDKQEDAAQTEPTSTDDAKMETVETEVEEVAEEQKVKKELAADGGSSTIVPMTKDYTGYRLVIHFSRFPLPKEHKIFQTNGTVIDYTTADSNHLYMIGHFKTLRAAKAHLRDKTSKEYPQSYIVGFEKGVRVY